MMFALPEILTVLKNFTFCPVCPCESTEHGHLIFIVNSHRIVCGCMSKSVSPNAFAAIEICPGVASDVLTVNPQIHVELVSMGRAGAKVRAAEDGFAVCVVEHVGAAVTERNFSLTPNPSPGRRGGFCAT